MLRRLIAPLVARSRFAHDERGAVAVEFAILAVPFFALIFAIIETSLTFFAGQILDSAVHDASRKIRTGQAQNAADGGWDAADFRQAICDGLYGLMNCANVKIKVSVISNFSAATFTSPIGEDCTSTSPPEDCEWAIVESYTPGASSEVVMVQAHYKWPTIVNIPGMSVGAMPDGTRLLSAVRVFKNEPF